MTEFTVTARGDRVAYDRRGSGPALIFIAGAGPFRAMDPVTTETATLAAERGITTFVYDRLGRGESPVEGRIDLDRELEAVAALLGVAGGRAVLCGHSSGCSIALAAAARGLPVAGLALWEAPLGPPDGGAREWAAEVDRLIEAGELDAALVHYMKDIPPEYLEYWRDSPEFPALVANVGSLRPDGESLAWAESAPLSELCAGIRVPVEALVGEETLPIMLSAADAIVAAIPGAVQKRMPGAQHEWQAAPMAAELAAFVTAAFETATDAERGTAESAMPRQES
ncbi:alpha/beta fold hydrolase [Microterricola pindariensis]|uniref:Alpha/beta hydrolase n=1 Tax=Microterricola pindariensis TaxID=478010 RepID=A0ABX5AUZ9_9MICO|nr:alpha/beta hydrolase [Microterricola pindariensis]PPL18655.1 alpha/beta hydrolase [Microterricola pindariensis]